MGQSKKISERKTKPLSTAGLNDQQLKFIDELFRTENFRPSEAAAKAGYKHPSVMACKLMDHPVISSVINRRITERREKCKIDADRVLLELTHIGLVDPATMFDSDGCMLEVRQMPEATRRAIAAFDVSVTEDKYGNVTTKTKVKLWDKNAALQSIANHLGMLNQKLLNQQGVEGGTTNIIALILERVTGKSNIVDQAFIEADARLSEVQPPSEDK